MCLFRFSLFSACCAVVLVGHVSAGAPEKNTYTVEEDWQLVLRAPSTAKASPQFVTHFPLGGTTYIQTCWNFKDAPDFSPGGIQLQLWDGDHCLETVDVNLASLHLDGDTVRWTQVYTTNSNDVTMKIVGVNSQSWGTNINTTSIAAGDANVANFNTYNPNNSLEESHVSFGGNRVSWFGMTAVRTYDDRGRKITEDTTLRPVIAH